MSRARSYIELLGDSEACLRQVDRAIAAVEIGETITSSLLCQARFRLEPLHAHLLDVTARLDRGGVLFAARDDLLRLANQPHVEGGASRQIAYASSVMLDVETQLAQLTSILGQDASASENSPADSA